MRRPYRAVPARFDPNEPRVPPPGPRVSPSGDTDRKGSGCLGAERVSRYVGDYGDPCPWRD